MKLARNTQHGRLELNFEAVNGKTVLMKDFQRTPLQIVRPFEQPDGSSVAFIVNPTAGTMAGDLLEIEVSVGPGARVMLLTQAAQRIHRMNVGRVAIQTLAFQVHAGGRLEYYPERVLPFAESDFSSTMRATLEAGAEFAFLETYAVGRVLHGERLRFRRLCSRVEVWRGEVLEYLDTLSLEPEIQNLSAKGALEGANFWASGLFMGAKPPSSTPRSELLVSGFTYGGAVWLRGLSSSGPGLDLELTGARDQLRGELFGVAPLRIRRT